MTERIISSRLLHHPKMGQSQRAQEFFERAEADDDIVIRADKIGVGIFAEVENFGIDHYRQV